MKPILWSRVLSVKPVVPHLIKNFLSFHETEDLLSCAEDTAIGLNLVLITRNVEGDCRVLICGINSVFSINDWWKSPEILVTLTCLCWSHMIPICSVYKIIVLNTIKPCSDTHLRIRYSKLQESFKYPFLCYFLIVFFCLNTTIKMSFTFPSFLPSFLPSYPSTR
jgi:hypothetical protein